MQTYNWQNIGERQKYIDQQNCGTHYNQKLHNIYIDITINMKNKIICNKQEVRWVGNQK